LKVDELGALSRLIGALVTKAGVPVPTEINFKVLATGQHLVLGIIVRAIN